MFQKDQINLINHQLPQIKVISLKNQTLNNKLKSNNKNSQINFHYPYNLNTSFNM